MCNEFQGYLYVILTVCTIIIGVMMCAGGDALEKGIIKLTRSKNTHIAKCAYLCYIKKKYRDDVQGAPLHTSIPVCVLGEIYDKYTKTFAQIKG